MNNLTIENLYYRLVKSYGKLGQYTTVQDLFKQSPELGGVSFRQGELLAEAIIKHRPANIELEVAAFEQEFSVERSFRYEGATVEWVPVAICNYDSGAEVGYIGKWSLDPDVKGIKIGYYEFTAPTFYVGMRSIIVERNCKCGNCVKDVCLEDSGLGLTEQLFEGLGVKKTKLIEALGTTEAEWNDAVKRRREAKEKRNAEREAENKARRKESRKIYYGSVASFEMSTEHSLTCRLHFPPA